MPHREALLSVIRAVRRRWRSKIVLRSVVVLALAAVAAVVVAALGLEYFRFSPGAVVAARVGTYLVFAVLGWVYFVRPLARRVTDLQVALYLEEHEPALDALLVSAVDAGSSGHGRAESGESAALLTRLVEDAVARCQASDLGRSFERRSLVRSGAALAVVAAVTTALFALGPAFLRQGAIAVLVPVTGLEAASPYRIDVSPGHSTVALGSDVLVQARLRGFSATDADLFTRVEPTGAFERTAMTPDTGGAFELMLFDVKTSTDYFVQAAGVRSPVFTIDAANLPYVEHLQLEYVFPAYTGLDPVIVEDGGDIAALRGTTVRLRVRSTMPTSAGRIVRDARTLVPMAVETDGTLTGTLPLDADGLYRLELATADGTFVAASPQYTIDVLSDEPPVVTFSKPARDLRATSIDEVYVEADADDDFGIRQLDLVYAVNGGVERSVRLSGQGRPQKALSAGHTFFLEELGLQPGDVVAYYARATDNDGVGGAKRVTSDIFFVQIQPFRKDYRAAESQAGGQAPGGNQGNNASDPSALSEQQRRIVSGTFNLDRDKDKAGPDKFRQDAVFLALAQGQLKERATALSAQILARVADADPVMKTIATQLTQAASAMGAAEQSLQARNLRAALPAEQQALAHLQRAEDAYRDVRVRMERQQGGGGGGGQGSSAAADELADLFQLEMDKLRNQYETFQRSRQQEGDNKVDEMLERLKELARRQEQEAERQRQAGARGQAGGSASAARQRQLAEDTEDAARQLERLSREEGRADLAQTARGLRQAADTMRRAAASGDTSAFAQARDAAERLGQARDRLDQQRTDRLANRIDEQLQRVRRLADTQAQIGQDVARLEPSGTGRRTQVQRLLERKDTQAAEVADIERQLDRTASEFRRERQQAARKVQAAADAIRDQKLKEKIRYSRGTAQNAPPETAAEFERQLGSDISGIEARLREAAAAAGAPERDGRAEALDRARALVRGVESQEQRMRAGAGGEQDARGTGGGTRPGAEASGDSRPVDGGGDPRQFQREDRERRTEAEALRRELQALGVDTAELEALIGRMRALEGARASADPAEAARMRSALAEGFRRFEFGLRRQFGEDTAKALLLSAPDAVPERYKKATEEYYRSLARERKR